MFKILEIFTTKKIHLLAELYFESSPKKKICAMGFDILLISRHVIDSSPQGPALKMYQQ
jgi:hypothetical protein